MAADAGMETCPSPEMGDSRKRPLDTDTENESTKRSHVSPGKLKFIIFFLNLLHINFFLCYIHVHIFYLFYQIILTMFSSHFYNRPINVLTCITLQQQIILIMHSTITTFSSVQK